MPDNKKTSAKGKGKRKLNNEADHILTRTVNMRGSKEVLGEDSVSDATALRNAQTMMLQMQINPHFLGNTLNVINWMAIEMTMSENNVSKAIGKLSRLFKSYSDTAGFMTDFDTEMEFTMQYAEILMLRYPDTFSINWDVDDRYLNARVPRIILQPLVENAVYHGIRPLGGAGSVTVSTRMEDNYFIMEVSDSGKGMSEESISKINEALLLDVEVPEGHIGLRNVNQRLRLIYGNDYDMHLEKSPSGGLLVVVRIPYVFEYSRINNTNRSVDTHDSVIATLKTLDLIIKKMMSERKRVEPNFLPYTTPIGYRPNYPSFSFEKVYPDWQEGDTGYVMANLVGPCDKELVISVTGDTEVFFNGEKLSGYDSEYVSEPFKVHGIKSYRAKFKEGENPIIISQHAASEYFSFEIYVGSETGPVTWPVEYLYKLTSHIPFGSMKGMEGFSYSRLYKKGEALPPLDCDIIQWQGPSAPDDVENINFNFKEMCKKDTVVATALTWAKGDVRILHDSPLKIYVEEDKVYESPSGVFEITLEHRKLLCVEAERNGKSFGFSAESGDFSVKGFESDRRDLSWIWLENVKDVHKNIQFKAPYTTINGKKTFFKYLRKDTYYKLYHNSHFYGTWFYANLFAHLGILAAGKRLKKPELISYFTASIGMLCDYIDYAQYDYDKFKITNLLYSSVRLRGSSSVVGPAGMVVCEYNALAETQNSQKLLAILENALETVPRDKDGLFDRRDIYTTDDFYMLLPFFARLGGKYISEGVKNIKGWYNYLYMEDKKVFSHIYFKEEGKANRVPWARGNGWAMFSLSDFIINMPENHPDRDYVVNLFQEFSEGILSFQDKDGMWHQLLDEHETYEESSGTSMFIIAMARAVKHGFLSRDIIPKLWKAWNRLSEICIDDEGNIFGISGGASVSVEREKYRKMSANLNNDHGVGAVLWAGVEMLDL